MINISLKIIPKLRVVGANISFIKEWTTVEGTQELWYSLRKFSQQTQEHIPMEHIRNFSIIAHIDHGKSTLADRLLEITGAITKSKENEQVLDRLPVEKERGITVKAVAATLNYSYKGKNYQLNLIDTPGHVDFSHEVSRSLSACQGAILLVDANEGIQAQTVANYYLALKKKLTIIPALNKIDLKHADPERVESELKSVLGMDTFNILRLSAKTGFGVEDLLVSIIENIPPPTGDRNQPFKAMIIDSWYDTYRGIVSFICIKSGVVKVGEKYTSHFTGLTYVVKTVGKLCPDEVSVDCLCAGQVGVITSQTKNAKEVQFGDTIFAFGADMGDIENIESPKQTVFSGLFPKNNAEYAVLKSALEKLLMNDPAVSVASESSPALGYGWRLGFLGLLHLDVFRQRLEQEFDKETVLTAPSVTYKLKIIGAKNIKKYGGDTIEVRNPSQYPDGAIIKEMFEPIVLATIISPIEYLQDITEECVSRRGTQESCQNLTNNRVMIKFMLPLSEIILDFHDTLKRMTSGYASFDYEDKGYKSTSLEKLIIFINGKEVEELVTIVHSSRVRELGRKLALKLKESIPRQVVSITIQAMIHGKVIAREDIRPYRKDVTAKLYGGDVTRRMKLLRAQREGKEKMRQFANIEIPKDTFIDVLRNQ